MKTKNKGIMAERELRTLLQQKGFFANRSPASLSMDVYAYKHGKGYGFEVKSTKNKEKFYLSKEIKQQLIELIDMGKEYGFTEVFLAIKYARTGWNFYSLMQEDGDIFKSPKKYREQARWFK